MSDLNGWAALVAATGAAVASVMAARRSGQVRHQVKTMNEMTVGQLANAAETRRVDAIEPGDRTAREARHVATARDLPAPYAPAPPTAQAEPTPPHDPPGPDPNPNP